MTPYEREKCCLCDRETNTQVCQVPEYGALFKCEVCGRYDAAQEFITSIESGVIGAETRAELSAAVREANQYPAVATGESPFGLSLQNYESFARQHRSTVPEKIDKLLLLLARRSHIPGNDVPLSPELDYPLVDARSPNELRTYIQYLQDCQLLTSRKLDVDVSQFLRPNHTRVAEGAADPPG